VPPDPTPWSRLADAEPIAVRDPLAELLGMVPPGEPLTVTFPEVAKAAGHACPAVAGAYRCTQLALAALYPDSLPVRSAIAVTVGGSPTEPGVGPMTDVVRHVTGAADESGFEGLAGCGGRRGLLTFEDASGPGRTFAFERVDTGARVRVSFDPSATGVDPDAGGGDIQALLPKLLDGRASAAARDRFYAAWHGRVARILRAEPDDSGPISLRRG